MRKIIFLDFDGVLNSREYLSKVKHLSVYDRYQSHLQEIDPVRLSLLNKLVAETKAEVVFHTSWGNFFSLEELNSLLRERGATFQGIDKTPRQAPILAEDRRISDYIHEWRRINGTHYWKARKYLNYQS